MVSFEKLCLTDPDISIEMCSLKRHLGFAIEFRHKHQSLFQIHRLAVLQNHHLA